MRNTQNDIKSPPEPAEQSFPQKSCSNLVLGLVCLCFGRFQTPLGSLLGQLLEALGRLLASLGRFLGASWAIVGRSWPFLSWFGPPLGCIMAPRASPGLDFGGLGDTSALVLEAFGRMFWHAFCCASHFVTKCFSSCCSHVFSFTCALRSSLPVRRSVRSTWN